MMPKEPHGNKSIPGAPKSGIIPDKPKGVSEGRVLVMTERHISKNQ